MDEEGNPCQLTDQTRRELEDAEKDGIIPICVCFKDFEVNELEGVTDEDMQEFLSDQTGFTLVAMAYFKNPVNIWIPSCVSKLSNGGVKTKLITSSPFGKYYGRECGILSGDQDELFDAREFYEKAQNDRFWLEQHIHQIILLIKSSAIHKYYFVDTLMNMNEEVMVVSNKADDLGIIKRAHLGISIVDQSFNSSCLYTDSQVLVTPKGFLDLADLFNHAAYIEEATKISFIYSLSTLISVLFMSIFTAIFKGDDLFQPIHLIILLIIEVLTAEFFYNSVIEDEDVTAETRNEDMTSQY